MIQLKTNSHGVHNPRTLHTLLLLMVVASACVANFHAFSSYVLDDAYITYRYSENLAAGRGFVFNQGERVLGTTTPLYTLLLALLRLIGFDIPTISGALFCASLSGLALTGALLLRRFGFPNLALIYATFTVWGPGSIFHFFGLETPFLILLCFLSFTAAIDEKPVLAGVLTGLAILTRYDAGLFAFGLCILMWYRNSSLPWRYVTAGAAVVVPWLVYAQLYFGTWIPQTLAAKEGWASFLGYLYSSARLQAETVVSPLYRFVPRNEIPFSVVLAVSIGLIVVIPAKISELSRRNPLLLQLVLFPTLLWAAYAVIGPPTIFQWHLLPAIYFLILASFVCWGHVFRMAKFSKFGSAATIVLAARGKSPPAA